tara:strand:- start:414 stop:542 length:129 start_codon:yes stop_codon:yes gene_type:complete
MIAEKRPPRQAIEMWRSKKLGLWLLPSARLVALASKTNSENM